MTISKLFGAGSLSLINSLQKTRKELNQSFNRLASGQKNLIAQSPAQAALATNLKSQVSSLNQINQGIQLSQLALNTAGGALSTSSDLLQDLRALAVQASNGTLGTSERTAINNQAQELLNEVDRISSETSFNGQALLDGSFSQQVVVSEQSSKTISVGSSSLASLGLDNIDLSTQEGAQDALAAIDAAIEANVANQVQVGAQVASLEYSYSSNQVTAENLSSAYSQIADVDIAEEMVNLNLLEVQSKAQIALLEMQNKLYTQFSDALIKGFNSKK